MEDDSFQYCIFGYSDEKKYKPERPKVERLDETTMQKVRE